MRYRVLMYLAILATGLGIGHHIDHIIRGNHVGWPVSDEVTPFTYSLGFYPVIALGFYLTLTGRVGPGFWAVLAGAGALFVGLTHFGPVALEPPADIVGVYDSRLAGWLALALLVAFLATLVGVTLYALRLYVTSRSGGAKH